MSIYHYSRVSLAEQTTENQSLAVKQAGYNVDYWYSDSGVSGGVDALHREQFALMSAKMERGDTLIVSAVDRIGRKTANVISTIEDFHKRGIKVIVLAYGSLDLASDIGMAMISIAAVFAQLERADLKARTKRGMARVKESGTRLGQPLKITPDMMESIASKKQQGISIESIAQSVGIAKNTVQRNLAKWGGDLQGYRKEYSARKEQYAMNA